MVMKILKQGRMMRNLALTLAFLAITNCAGQPSDWVDVPLQDGVFYQQRFDFNSDIIEIHLDAQQDLEYMVNMKQGGSISYDWQAVNLTDPELLLAEFHGHTIREDDMPGEVMFYKEGRDESSEGYLVAPFDGIHGWYFSNESMKPINIVLTISGFYSIIEGITDIAEG